MIKKVSLIILNLLSVASNVCQTEVMRAAAYQAYAEKIDAFPTFFTWDRACQKLPKYMQLTPAQRDAFLYQAVEFDEFERTLKKFIATMQATSFACPSCWLGAPPAQDIFSYPNTRTQPMHVQKLIVPEDATVCLRGDLHGDIHAFTMFLQDLTARGYMDPRDPFKIMNSKFYMIFLGDYVDRGIYGLEVMYTIMRLKIANPDRVFFARGNHEDFDLNAARVFTQEVATKFKQSSFVPGSQALVNQLYRVYDFMPVALWLGVADDDRINYLQCCHGGVELGFKPNALLSAPGTIRFQKLGKLYRKDEMEKMPPAIKAPFINLAQRDANFAKELANYYPKKPMVPFKVGYMWNDFIVDGVPVIRRHRRRGWQYGKLPTQYILHRDSGTRHQVRGVVRAHQHSSKKDNPMMHDLLKHRGIAKLWNHDKRDLWDGMVATFMVAPNTNYAKKLDFTYDTYALLKVDKKFDRWRMQKINIDGVGVPESLKIR